MPDKYANFAELAAREIEGVHYRVCLTDRNARVAVFAPHGGEIEPVTSRIAAAIAADSLSLYCFEGLVPGRAHGDLHIRSERFDEPRGRKLAASCEIVIGVHGRKDEEDGQTVWLGGGDTRLCGAIGEALTNVGFKVKNSGHRLPGTDPNNICNAGLRRAGIQLEIPRTLRNEMVADTARLEAFAAAIRAVVGHDTEVA